MAKPADKVAPHKFGQSVLAKHASSKDTILFNEEIRVGTFRFYEGMVVKFEDPAMAAYMDVCFNGTEFTTKKPNVTIGADELNFDPAAEGETVDPHTVIGTGREGVMPGTTAIEHLTGKPGAGRVALEPHDSGAAASSEG